MKTIDFEAENSSISLAHLLMKRHNITANKGKLKDFKGQLPLQDIFCFCKTFFKTTEQMGLHLIFKAVDLQNIIEATLAYGITVQKRAFFFISSNIDS